MIALYPMIAVINAVITCSSHCSDQMQKYIRCLKDVNLYQ